MLGVEDQAIFAGNLDQDWLSKVVSFTSAFISPHIGMALSEAALGGIPLVAPVVAPDVDWKG